LIGELAEKRRRKKKEKNLGLDIEHALNVCPLKHLSLYINHNTSSYTVMTR